MRPDTQYAQASDGTYVAYQVFGNGPRDLVVAMGAGIPIEDQMDNRECATFMRRLASFSRVIRFDRHGIGMSDPLSGENTLEQWVDDAQLVLNETGSEAAALFGTDSAGTALVTMFAASHPERVTHLVMLGARARFTRTVGYPWGWAIDELEDRLDDVVRSRLKGELPALAPPNPRVANDAEFLAWLIRAQRRGLSPSRVRIGYEAMWRTDLRPILGAIAAPTLLITGADDVEAQDHAKYFAEHLQEARNAQLPIVTGSLFAFLGDIDPLVDEVEEFITGVRSHTRLDRALATVLFSDIVDSTVHATALGDRLWRERLDEHDSMVRRNLEQFRGREIKTTGDGFLATFDGPARAIHCGCAIRDGAARLGIAVRIGVHTGEVELRGDDIGGISVHTAARVQAHARADEICVSRTVVDLVAGSGISFDDRGEHNLKGIPGTWQLFAVDG